MWIKNMTVKLRSSAYDQAFVRIFSLIRCGVLTFARPTCTGTACFQCALFRQLWDRKTSVRKHNKHSVLYGHIHAHMIKTQWCMITQIPPLFWLPYLSRPGAATTPHQHMADKNSNDDLTTQSNDVDILDVFNPEEYSKLTCSTST